MIDDPLLIDSFNADERGRVTIGKDRFANKTVRVAVIEIEEE